MFNGTDLNSLHESSLLDKSSDKNTWVDSNLIQPARQALLEDIFVPARNAADMLTGRKFFQRSNSEPENDSLSARKDFPPSQREIQSVQGDLPSPSTNTAEYLTHLLITGAIGAATYAVCGRFAGGALRGLAGTVGLEGGCAARLVGSEMTGQLTGAAVHDFFLDARDGRSRAANVMSSVATFGTYEMCNRSLASRSLLLRGLALAPIGAAGASLGYLTRQSVSGDKVDLESLKSASLDGAALNLLLPAAQHGSGKILDAFNVGLGRGVPLEREMNYRNLNDKSSVLSELYLGHSLMRVQPTSNDFGSVSHHDRLIELPGAASGSNGHLLAHELAHRDALTKFEAKFELAQSLLAHDEIKARETFIDARSAQENYARGIENQVIKQLKDCRIEQPNTSQHSSATLNLEAETRYKHQFEAEFEGFKEHQGQWRPEFDFGHLGGPGIDLAKLQAHDNPAEIVSTLYEVLPQAQQKGLTEALKQWKSQASGQDSAFSLIYGLEPKAIRQAFTWSTLHDYIAAKVEHRPLCEAQHILETLPLMSEFNTKLHEHLADMQKTRENYLGKISEAKNEYSSGTAKLLDGLIKAFDRELVPFRQALGLEEQSRKGKLDALSNSHQQAVVELDKVYGMELAKAEIRKNNAVDKLYEKQESSFQELRNVKEAAREELFKSDISAAKRYSQHLRELRKINDDYDNLLDALHEEHDSKTSFEREAYKRDLGDLANVKTAIASRTSENSRDRSSDFLSNSFDYASHPFSSLHEELVDSNQDELQWSCSNLVEEREADKNKSYARLLHDQPEFMKCLNQIDEDFHQKMQKLSERLYAEAGKIRDAYGAVRNSPREQARLEDLAALEKEYASKRSLLNNKFDKSLDDLHDELFYNLSEREEHFEQGVQKLLQDFDESKQSSIAELSKAEEKFGKSMRKVSEDFVRQLGANGLPLPQFSPAIANDALASALTFANRSSLWYLRRIGEVCENGAHDKIDIPVAMHLRDSKLGEQLLTHSSHPEKDLAVLARQWDKVAKVSTSEKTSFAEMINIARSFERFPGALVPDLAREAASGPAINRTIYLQVEADYLASLAIPDPFPTDVSWREGALVGRFLPRSDVRRLFMGNHTNSCMRIGAANEDGVVWLQKSPQAGMFAIEDARGQILAASRVWLDPTETQVCFNSIQSKGSQNKDLSILKLYKQAANYLVNEENVSLVTVGTEHSKVNISTLTPSRYLVPLPKDLVGLNDCSKQQMLLAGR